MINSRANPLAPRNNRLQAKSAQIKEWTRDLLELSDDTPLSIAELACRDEGCPDLETVIGVFEPNKLARTVRIHLPINEVTLESIKASIASSND